MRPRLAIIGCLIVVSGSLGASADEIATLTLTGPTTIGPGIPGTYQGALTVAGVGIGLQEIEILSNGARAAATTTGIDGTYTSSITHSITGSVVLQAVAYRNTPAELRSTPLVIGTDLVAPDPPDLSASSPASPSRVDSDPLVEGTSEPGSTVRLYATSTCDGSTVGIGVADPAGQFSIPSDLPDNATTTLHGTAADAAENVSSCSSSSIRYTHDSLSPVFEGAVLASAGSAGDITVRWEAATDNMTMSDLIVYDVCHDTSPTSCSDAFTIAETSAQGATWHTFDDLAPDATHYFVVRARDVVGNRDMNRAVVSGSFVTPAVALSAGVSHTCAILSDATTACWGENAYGQLGDGTMAYHSSRVRVSGLLDAVGLAAGQRHSCALRSTGAAVCWGNNSTGELGDGSMINHFTPVAVSGLEGATAVAVGGSHSCALLSDGTVRCWGGNSFGQLGDGTTTDRSAPISVSGIHDAIAITAGMVHTCAVFTDGSARCWGYNGKGQLGDGSTTIRLLPVDVVLADDAAAISAGAEHTCAQMSDGTARCWGYNALGQLGDGTTTNRTVPVPVSDLSGIAEISGGRGAHTCAVLLDSTARCWGNNQTGALGNPSAAQTATTPVAVRDLSQPPYPDLTGVVGIGGGFHHTCGLLAEGAVRCWGATP